MATELRRGFEFDRLAVYLDDQGEPAKDIDGDPTWESSDPGVINVFSPPVLGDHVGDPFWATVQAVGPVGSTAEVSATADADVSEEGFVPVTIRGNVNVVSGAATSGSFTDTEVRPIAST